MRLKEEKEGEWRQDKQREKSKRDCDMASRGRGIQETREIGGKRGGVWRQGKRVRP